MSQFVQDSRGIYRCLPLLQFDWLDHGLGTRHAGLHAEDFITLQQIHSAKVWSTNDLAADLPGLLEPGVTGRAESSRCEGDALLTNVPGQTVAIKTADCVPILIVDPEHQTVAAIHAGWRGTDAKIAVAAVARMTELYDSSPSALFAAIGPCIGPCCYEVGPDVARRFAEYDSGLNGINEPVRIDLASINARQLRDSGLPERQIFSSGLCTFCKEEFFSFRRERDAAGRMLSFAGRKPLGWG